MTAGEARLVKIEDRNAAIETVRREKATKEPGSIGASMSGVVVEIRVKEGQDVKAGDPCVFCLATAASSIRADAYVRDLVAASPS